MTTQTTFKEHEGFNLCHEERIQCKTYGTCEVVKVSNDEITIRNDLTKEVWTFEKDDWIAENWDLLSSLPYGHECNCEYVGETHADICPACEEIAVHWVCPECKHGQTDWVLKEDGPSAEVICEMCDISIPFESLDATDRDKFYQARKG